MNLRSLAAVSMALALIGAAGAASAKTPVSHTATHKSAAHKHRPMKKKYHRPTTTEGHANQLSKNVNHETNRESKDFNHSVNGGSKATNHYTNGLSKNVNHETNRESKDFNHSVNNGSKAVNHSLNQFSKDVNHTFQGKKKKSAK